MKSFTKSSMALLLSVAIASSAIVTAPQVDAKSSSTSTKSPKITRKKAISIAKKDSGASRLISCELDYENGKLVYEIELSDGKNREYDWVIDARTGKVLESEVDSVDWKNMI